jgi:hypothetical protein
LTCIDMTLDPYRNEHCCACCGKPAHELKPFDPARPGDHDFAPGGKLVVASRPLALPMSAPELTEFELELAEIYDQEEVQRRVLYEAEQDGWDAVVLCRQCLGLDRDEYDRVRRRRRRRALEEAREHVEKRVVTLHHCGHGTVRDVIALALVAVQHLGFRGARQLAEELAAAGLGVFQETTLEDEIERLRGRARIRLMPVERTVGAAGSGSPAPCPLTPGRARSIPSCEDNPFLEEF